MSLPDVPTKGNIIDAIRALEALPIGSVYDMWLAAGHVGDENDCLRWLKATYGGYGNVGEIFMWSQDTPPDDGLWCDGSAVDRVEYAELFDVIGEQYGAGDGSTTFNLPDLRGEFIRGYDPEGVRDSDPYGDGIREEVGKHQKATEHPYIYALNALIVARRNSAGRSDILYPDSDYQDYPAATNRDVAIGGQGNVVGHNSYASRPINVNLMFCIRYKRNLPNGYHIVGTCEGKALAASKQTAIGFIPTGGYVDDIVNGRWVCPREGVYTIYVQPGYLGTTVATVRPHINSSLRGFVFVNQNNTSASNIIPAEAHATLLCSEGEEFWLSCWSTANTTLIPTGSEGASLFTIVLHETIEGKDGKDGKSAYELWIDDGNVGELNDFLEAQKGGQGDPGKSAYELWLEAGNYGNTSDFLESLKGEPGGGFGGVNSNLRMQTGTYWGTGNSFEAYIETPGMIPKFLMISPLFSYPPYRMLYPWVEGAYNIYLGDDYGSYNRALNTYAYYFEERVYWSAPYSGQSDQILNGSGCEYGYVILGEATESEEPGASPPMIQIGAYYGTGDASWTSIETPGMCPKGMMISSLFSYPAYRMPYPWIYGSGLAIADSYGYYTGELLVNPIEGAMEWGNKPYGDAYTMFNGYDEEYGYIIWGDAV